MTDTLQIVDEGIKTGPLDPTPSYRDAMKHRRQLRARRGGYKPSSSPCSSCGHRICRCADRKARSELLPGK